MLELFGLFVGAIMLVPVLIVAGLALAVLCGVGHIFGFVWELFWGVFGVVFGLLFVFGLMAAGTMALMFAILF